MQSMDEIYQEYADMVYRFVLARSGDQHIAEEITAETFYQAVRSIDKFDESCKVSTWLCSIAKNQLAAYLRKNHIQSDIEDVDAQVPSTEEDYIWREDRLTLMKLLHGVPDPYREVIYLRVFGGLSFRDIGDIMEKSENWARVTFYRGKDRIRKETENGK